MWSLRFRRSRLSSEHKLGDDVLEVVWGLGLDMPFDVTGPNHKGAEAIGRDEAVPAVTPPEDHDRPNMILGPFEALALTVVPNDDFPSVIANGQVGFERMPTNARHTNSDACLRLNVLRLIFLCGNKQWAGELGQRSRRRRRSLNFLQLQCPAMFCLTKILTRWS